MKTRINKKILIVDDETPLLEALVYKFENEGFEVISARDGEDGLKKALAHQPDMILLDIVMPKMDGITVLEKLRANAWGKSAKVIVLTNLTDLDSTNRVIEHRVHDMLIKTDWQISEVVKKVKKDLNLE